MSKFNSVFVHCVEDENLYGKYGFFSDSLEDLKQRVVNDSLQFWGKLSRNKSSTDNYPFVKQEDSLHYRYFYYDPKLLLFFGNKPGVIVTYRELSQWLAQGNGEGIYTTFPNAPHLTFTELRYQLSDENQPVVDIKVRKWNDSEWNIPTSYYLGLESKKED